MPSSTSRDGVVATSRQSLSTCMVKTKKSPPQEHTARLHHYLLSTYELTSLPSLLTEQHMLEGAASFDIDTSHTYCADEDERGHLKTHRDYAQTRCSGV